MEDLKMHFSSLKVLMLYHPWLNELLIGLLFEFLIETCLGITRLKWPF